MLNPYKKADVSFDWLKDLDEQGCFSRVYLAHDNHLAHDLIIKEIPKDPTSQPDEYFREARTVYKNAHPNIVQIQYAAQCQENVYIAMPFYKNGSLNGLMKTKNLSPREIIRYSLHFLSALNHIHSKNLVHFDIKPNNILISDRNEALLSDFGLAQLLDIAGRATPDNGYFFHSPPEFYTVGANYNLTFDIYQAGMTIHRMCVGHTSFEQERGKYTTAKQLAEDIISGDFPSKTYSPIIPKKLSNIVKNCLKIDPNERYQSVQDILNALSEISDGALDWFEINRLDTPNLKEWNKKVDGATLKVVYNTDTKDATGQRVYDDGRSRKESKLSSSNCSNQKLYGILKDN
ncbi:serine/threonine protein kinase [Pantoea sp. PNA 14-12]|uniref:serine/threonine-protein kinase n=1 Tax=Pantoea TaxID=53335 RepID=UPI00105D2C98|nr:MULTISPECIES: serine/threonine-protein kinase [Pantoea]TDS68008.1 serine/threonine protein kinase [Pantoea sp. PNA 14-12]